MVFVKTWPAVTCKNNPKTTQSQLSSTSWTGTLSNTILGQTLASNNFIVLNFKPKTKRFYNTAHATANSLGERVHGRFVMLSLCTVEITSPPRENPSHKESNSADIPAERNTPPPFRAIGARLKDKRHQFWQCMHPKLLWPQTACSQRRVGAPVGATLKT